MNQPLGTREAVYWSVTIYSKNLIHVSSQYNLTAEIEPMQVLFMVFNATFNNISAISWWSVLLVEETGVPGENHRPVASH